MNASKKEEWDRFQSYQRMNSWVNPNGVHFMHIAASFKMPMRDVFLSTSTYATLSHVHRRDRFICFAGFIPEEPRALHGRCPSASSASDSVCASSGEERDEPKGKKAKIQVLSRRNARNANSTMEKVLQRKIYVSPSRAEALKRIYEDERMATHGSTSAMDHHEDSIPGQGMQSEGAKSDEKIRVLLIGFEAQQVFR
jgi:hypothetical protein